MAARPRKPLSERKDNILRIRLTTDERVALDEAARLQDEETSTWARAALLRLAAEIHARQRRRGRQDREQDESE